MNISLEFKNAGLIYDRYLGEKLKLPYTLDQIKIQANDTVTAELINLKFSHLYDNFLYLYKNTLVASNIIPAVKTAVAGISAINSAFTWQPDLSSREFISISSNDLLLAGVDNTTEMLLIKNNDFDRYTLFTTEGTSIQAFNFNSKATYITKVYEVTQVDVGYGVDYKNICDIDKYGNYIFVLDSVLNRIVKYEATGFTELNVITNNRLTYIDSIGNYGGFSSKTNFNNPQAITIYQDMLYVLDSGNKCIKRYDLNLNWQFTYHLYREFLSAFPLDITADKDGNMFILTNDSRLTRYDSNFIEKTGDYDISSLIAPGESFKKIMISQSDTNILYLVTDKNIFKKFVNKPYDTIGKYLLYLHKYNIADEQIRAFATAPADSEGTDRNIIFSVSGNNGPGKFGNFVDSANLFDILAVRDFDIYNLEEMSFSPNEYIQSWVLNKNITKQIINHMRLRDEIIGKYIATVDYYGNIAFKGTRYLRPEELEQIYFDQNITMLIGGNELITNTILNRPLEKIYNIQVAILEILAAEIIRKPKSNEPIRLSKA